MSDVIGAHNELHSERGSLPGEHPGRCRNPLIKVTGLAWLEFDKPDLERAETFAHAFGFQTAAKDGTELQLRGVDAGSPCVMIRRGPRSRFRGVAFRAGDEADVLRLAAKTGAPALPLPQALGGLAVNLVDPNGTPVKVVSGVHALPALPGQQPHLFNVGHEISRVNATQRPPREPARVQRLGHVVLQSTTYIQTLNWYLDHFGLIVSDFQYYAGQRERGPTMSFIRCDQGSTPSDHHTLAAGGEYLRDRGYVRSWGIGRHIQGSQIFDYWRDPDGFLVEHYADGDVFDDTLDTGWAPFTASGLAQWGPPVTKDFLEIDPKYAREQLGAIATALRGNNEFGVKRLMGMLKVARS